MNDLDQLDEKELERRFRGLNAPLSDEEFVRDVMNRARRSARLRRLTLVLSVVLGLAISAGPVVQIINQFAEWLSLVEMRGASSLHAMEISIVAVAALSIIVLPSALKWMSR